MVTVHSFTIITFIFHKGILQKYEKKRTMTPLMKECTVLDQSPCKISRPHEFMKRVSTIISVNDNVPIKHSPSNVRNLVRNNEAK